MMQRNAPRMLPEDFIPSSTDILCGRDQESYMHEGNRVLRKLIKASIPSYLAAKTKVSKSHIVASIVRRIRSAGSCTGFIRKDLESRRWVEIGETKAKEKVGQAIRIEIRRSKTNMPSSNSPSSSSIKRTSIGSQYRSNGSGSSSSSSSNSNNGCGTSTNGSSNSTNKGTSPALASALPIDPGFPYTLPAFVGNDDFVIQPDPILEPLARVGSAYVQPNELLKGTPSNTTARRSSPQAVRTSTPNVAKGNFQNTTKLPAFHPVEPVMSDAENGFSVPDLFNALTNSTNQTASLGGAPDAIGNHVNSINNSSINVNVNVNQSANSSHEGINMLSLKTFLNLGQNQNQIQHNAQRQGSQQQQQQQQHQIAACNNMNLGNTIQASAVASTSGNTNTNTNTNNIDINRMFGNGRADAFSGANIQQNAPMPTSTSTLPWPMSFPSMPFIGDIGDFDDL